MKLYEVYHNDPECPERIIMTTDKNKAIRFIDKYNKLNYKPVYDEEGREINQLTADKMYLIEIDLDEEERKFDKLFDEYKEYRYICIDCIGGNEFKLNTENSFIRYNYIEDKDYDYDEYEGFYVISSENDSYRVILREKIDTKDLNEDLIKKVKQKRKENSYLFQND